MMVGNLQAYVLVFSANNGESWKFHGKEQSEENRESFSSWRKTKIQVTQLYVSLERLLAAEILSSVGDFKIDGVFLYKIYIFMPIFIYVIKVMPRPHLGMDYWLRASPCP